jgi:lycopene beta-cyclase
MSSSTFDIAIIGAGAAGLHLALNMRDDPFFRQKKILILEKESKEQNDRTWCFWEKGVGKWDHLLRHTWANGDFFCMGDALPLHLAPYQYKMLRGIDFYAFAKKALAAHPQFTWQQDAVLSVDTCSPCHIACSGGQYTAEYVFDSRIPEAFFQQDQYTRLLQHFKGWVIRTPEDCFDADRFNMMDYRLQWKDSTSFTYVLPLNAREALVEFTLFTPSLIGDGDYETMLNRYLKEVWRIEKFDIVESEYGVIPMSDFPFEKYASDKHIRIGTAGGWVKPSSGYSFKNCERNAVKITENLKSGRALNTGIISRRFRLYDAVFLDVLNRHNERGPSIFHTMYFKNDVQQIFAFLDEETSLLEELRIISGFPKRLFLRSLINVLTRWL